MHTDNMSLILFFHSCILLMLVGVDDSVGAIYKALNRTNQLEDTVILFQLDHGTAEKSMLWEGGIRIPQFIHYPNGNLPDTFDGLVSTIDIGPSMLDIAGILNDPIDPDSLYEMDGKSWWDAVDSPGAWNDRCLFFEIFDDRALRCGCDKYMLLSSDSRELKNAVWYGWSGFEADQTEALFDLCDGTGLYIDANPSRSSPEAVNIAAEQPDKIFTYSALMKCHLNKTGVREATTVAPLYDECRLDELKSEYDALISGCCQWTTERYLWVFPNLFYLCALWAYTL